MKHLDEFNLKKSEIKKIMKAANDYSGFNDCKLTGYTYSIESPFEFDPDAKFAIVICQICRNHEERLDVDVELTVLLSDRRLSKAKVIS